MVNIFMIYCLKTSRYNTLGENTWKTMLVRFVRIARRQLIRAFLKVCPACGFPHREDAVGFVGFGK